MPRGRQIRVYIKYLINQSLSVKRYQNRLLFVSTLYIPGYKKRKSIKRTFNLLLHSTTYWGVILQIMYLFLRAPTKKEKKEQRQLSLITDIFRQNNCTHSFILIIIWSETCYGGIIKHDEKEHKVFDWNRLKTIA